MIPGPDYIYECPHCGNFLKKQSLVSGNTCYALHYSDGKMIAPMLPDFPNLTKCKKCDAIFWLSNLKKVGASWREDDLKEEWANAEYADFLNIKDLFIVLEMIDNPEKEKFIRI
jgi:hypothetical protein